MKTIHNTFLTSIRVLAVTLIFISCSKPEDGAAGPTGTANVIYSNWASAPVATATTIDGTNGNTTSIAATQLSQEILDKGTVLVYGKFSTTVFPLPYVSTAGGSANTLTYFPELNNIKLFRFKHDGSGGVSISTSVQFRYILIPGGTPVATGKQAQPDFKKMSYAEVCKYCQIPE
ncbi:hypothetical protein [Flavobacterium sp.]|uniref:hypothetical protein n=1 Tax=Flavobacterium sp. TaxID=239 RepID=UPI0038FCA003